VKSFIVVRLQAEGFHCWPDAPSQIAFLRVNHRHVFHVKLRIGVAHDDRELEFILVKRAAQGWFEAWLRSVDSSSCEQLAKSFVRWASATYGQRPVACEVSEDGENGAEVFNDLWSAG